MNHSLVGRIFTEDDNGLGLVTQSGPNVAVMQDYIRDGYVIAPCEQDKAGAGSFEVIAILAGAAIGITNIIVIAVILWGGRKLHKATFFCICNLALADMLAGLLLLWIFGLQKILLPFRTPQSELVQKSIWTITVWSSMLSQLVIAIDRYCYVTKGSPGDSGMSRNTRRSDKWGNDKRKRLIKAGITLTWFVPIVTYVLPVATTWNCVSTCFCTIPANSTTGVLYMVCTPVERCSQMNPPFAKNSVLFMGLTLLIMPIIPCVLYAKIYCFVRRSSVKLKTVYTPPLVAPSAAASARFAPNSDSSSIDHQISAPLPTLRPLITETSSPFISQHDGSGKVDDVRINDVRHKSSNQLGWKGWNHLREGSWRRKAMVTRIFTKNSRAEKAPELANRTASGASKAKSAATRRRYRDMRLLRTLVLILVLFLVSTVPLGILFVVSYSEQDKRYVGIAKVLLTTSLLNSLVNPWIYFWRFPEMRSAMRKVFCGSCRFFTPAKNSEPTRRYTGDAVHSVSNNRRGTGGALTETNSRYGRNGFKPECSTGKETSSSISSNAM